jgi:hypothetical protein
VKLRFRPWCELYEFPAQLGNEAGIAALFA